MGRETEDADKPTPDEMMQREFVRMVNDIRLDYGDGRGTLGVVGQRLMEIVAQRDKALSAVSDA